MHRATLIDLNNSLLCLKSFISVSLLDEVDDTEVAESDAITGLWASGIFCTCEKPMPSDRGHGSSGLTDQKAIRPVQLGVVGRSGSNRRLPASTLRCRGARPAGNTLCLKTFSRGGVR